MIITKRVLLYFVFLIFGFGLSAQNNPEITIQELKDHIYYLASDSLKGRKPGTPESIMAAEYIRNEFITSGLKPIGENGFQYFDVVMSVKPGEANMGKFAGENLLFENDFYPASFSSNGSVDAKVVFGGFGLDVHHDSVRWNSYENIDVEGKWVMVLRGDPEPDNDESLFISYAGIRDKALTARDQKAAGILFVKGPQFGNDTLLKKRSFSRVTADVGIPAAFISRNCADRILSESGKKINLLEESIISNKKPFGFNTGVVLKLQSDLERVTITTRNVITVIEGNDPILRNEYIVIGAHFDHLGFGGHGSGSRMPDTIAIHNGADDNASGTAGIIELAERLSGDKKTFRRSVVLMAFGAEEMGLLGSQFFVSNPVIDLKDVKVMINFDMIGRLDTASNSVMVAGTGTAVEMENILTDYEKNTGLSFGHSPEGYGASDHASFYASGVPVLFFSTGAHKDYHTPMDDADKINYQGEKEILDYVYPIIIDLINRDDNLTFKEAGPKKKTTGYGRGLKVKLGIMPDFTSSKNDGLGVGGVTNGGPASKAGMLKGDKIIAINGMEVTNIYDYMNRLKKLKPGQTISVDIIRNNEKKVLVVVL